MLTVGSGGTGGGCRVVWFGMSGVSELRVGRDILRRRSCGSLGGSGGGGGLFAGGTVEEVAVDGEEEEGKEMKFILDLLLLFLL